MATYAVPSSTGSKPSSIHTLDRGKSSIKACSVGEQTVVGFVDQIPLVHLGRVWLCYKTRRSLLKLIDALPVCYVYRFKAHGGTLDCTTRE